MQKSPSDLEPPRESARLARPGDHVRVRGKRWRIVDVQPHDSCRVFTLAGVDTADASVQQRFIHPFEHIDPVERRRTCAVVGAARWRRACREALAADDPYPSLSTARLAHIDLLPHQLEPALAILAGRGTRLLLADAVGLGKTIEAGLIVSELRARGWIERVLVLTPAGLRDQWRAELRERFDIDATHVDAPALRRIAGTLPVGFNPWTTVPTAIASVDYVKRAEVLPAVRACRWDIVIVDEAHGVVGDSDRRQAVEALASRAAYVLLLTATPHNGDAAAYDALRDIGSLDRDPLVVFRRSRAMASCQPRRRVRTFAVRLTREERRVHAALARYGNAVSAEADGAALAMSVLHKRAYSSAWALLQSVERRLAALDESGVDGEQLCLPLGDGMGEFSTADEAPEWPEELALADADRERRLLTAVASACAAAAPRESKVAAIGRLLRRVNEPIIVFTEYRDTLMHLQRRLAGVAVGDGLSDPPGRPVSVLLLHGGLSRHERREALRAFSQAEPRTILLATDAAAEGLNLHHVCRLVVNLELPWNPMRLEQRIGRVDRIGQSRRVHAIHLIARGTGESSIYARLQDRIARARLAVGAPNPLRDDPADDGGDAAATGDFAALAAAETARLTLVRAVARHESAPIVAEPDGNRAHIVSARRLRRIRPSIRSKALLMFRTTLTNAAGRRLASRIVAVLLDGVPRTRTRCDMTRTARDLAQAVAPRLDAFGSEWIARASDAVHTHMAARLRREESIAATLETTSPALFQTGLFDSRAQRSHDRHHTDLVDAQEDARTRMACIEAAGRIDAVGHELLLAILP